jgi:hypothetical protein
MGYFTIIINNYIYLLKIKQPRKPIRATARQGSKLKAQGLKLCGVTFFVILNGAQRSEESRVRKNGNRFAGF